MAQSFRRWQHFSIERWKAVLAVALILALAGNYADTLVPIETDTKNYIPQDLAPLIDLKHMKAYLRRNRLN